MNKVFQFGEQVDGYKIAVLNEREIRAAAGILFLFILISLMRVIFLEDFLLVKYAIVIFLTDLLIRVFVNPKYSPLLIIGRLIVRNQVPEYVGAAQKLFAWKIGIALATIIFSLLVIVNSYSEVIGLSCFICLIFLFFESAFGICLGCKFYSWYYKEKAQYCPGEMCAVTTNIQKTSKAQFAILFALIAYVFLTVYLFNDQFIKQPNDLWDMISSLSQ